MNQSVKNIRENMVSVLSPFHNTNLKMSTMLAIENNKAAFIFFFFLIWVLQSFQETLAVTPKLLQNFHSIKTVFEEW